MNSVSECVIQQIEQSVRLGVLGNTAASNLNAIDLAESYLELKNQTNKNTTDLARFLGRDRKYVTQLLKIARWADEAKDFAREHKFSVRSLTFIAKRKQDATK